MEDILSFHSSSIKTMHVAQAQPPPQSASIPGIELDTAPSMIEVPTSTSTGCSVPSCSI